MFEFEAVLIIITLVVLVSLAVFNKTCRKIIAGTMAFIAIIVGGFAAHDALAEDNFYYKVVFIDEVNNNLIHVDDLENIFAYWGGEKNITQDEELSTIALHFILDNGLYAEVNTNNVLTHGRIVVLKMFSVIENSIYDDQIVDVFYTQFITI